MQITDGEEEYRTGEQLLAAWNCNTREEKLERAVMALLENLEENHKAATGQSLLDNLTNTSVFCSCADAYRMGTEALRRPSRIKANKVKIEDLQKKIAAHSANLTNSFLLLERPHPLKDGSVQRIYRFKSGYGLSAVNSPKLHAYEFAWEFAVLKNVNDDGTFEDLDYTTELTSDVYVVSSDEEGDAFIALAAEKIGGEGYVAV